MFEFKKYSSIENTYQQELLDKVRELGYADPSIEWVATVKVDGSNFQISVDDEDRVHFGRRTAELSMIDNFYDWQQLVEREHWDDKIHALKKALNAKQVTVYCEIAGGIYNHPGVERWRDSKVQGRISYCPYHFTYAFDIRVTDDNSSRYLDYDAFAAACDSLGIFRCIELARGTFDDMLKVPNDGIDPVYKHFGLPAIEGNIMEGVVFKPVQPLYFRNGDRIIFKNKNEKFAEKMKAGTAKTRNEKPLKHSIELNSLEQSIADDMLLYRTEPRIYCVQSKLGEITQKDFGKLLTSFLEDLLEDYRKGNAERLAELEKLDQREFSMAKVTKVFADELPAWIRPYFLRMLAESRAAQLG